MSDRTRDEPAGVTPAPPPVERSWKKPAVLVAVFVLLVAGVPAVARPGDAFGHDGSKWSVQLGPGDQVLIGLPMPSDDVAITDVSPVVSDGIPVEVDVRRCELRQTALGSVNGGDVREFCLVPPPVDGLPAGVTAEPDLLDEAPGTLGGVSANDTEFEGVEQLVLVITPLEPGAVTIEDVRVTHSRGPFHRTESVGPTVEVEADPASAHG